MVFHKIFQTLQLQKNLLIFEKHSIQFWKVYSTEINLKCDLRYLRCARWTC